jgi:hypothetical protein
MRQGDDLGSTRRHSRGYERQMACHTIYEAVDEEVLTLPPICNSLTSPCARVKKGHSWHRSVTEASHGLRPARAGRPVSPHGCHRPANAATTDESRAWTTIVGHGADSTGGNR